MFTQLIANLERVVTVSVLRERYISGRFSQSSTRSGKLQIIQLRRGDLVSPVTKSLDQNSQIFDQVTHCTLSYRKFITVLQESTILPTTPFFSFLFKCSFLPSSRTSWCSPRCLFIRNLLVQCFTSVSFLLCLLKIFSILFYWTNGLSNIWWRTQITKVTVRCV